MQRCWSIQREDFELFRCIDSVTLSLCETSIYIVHHEPRDARYSEYCFSVTLPCMVEMFSVFTPEYIVMKMKNLDTGVLLLHRLTFIYSFIKYNTITNYILII